MDQQITAVIINRKEHKLKVTGSSDLEGLIMAACYGFCLFVLFFNFRVSHLDQEL